VVDYDRALAFLQRSRSGLVRTAAEWLVEYDDPVELLFVLSRDTADAMGPYETFRYASLLGLTRARAVHELGLDVLAEPLDDAPTPPVPHAFALAHARRAFPDEEAPYAGEVFDALKAREARGFHEGLVAAARVAAAWAAGLDAEGEARAVEVLLEAEDGVQVAATAFEALHLAGLDTSSALARVTEGQQDDGGLTALSRNDVIRGLTTLRVMCLLRPPGE
jgi:hypothetical protein